VKNKVILQGRESAGVQARGGANPPHRIVVVDGKWDVRESSAEVLIRHKANFPAKHIAMNRKQNQARNAAAECQL